MKEVAFRYGENNRGLGILTLPENSHGAPIVVLLNAGLLHRAEPYRLNVLVSRKLASLGYISLRVDISGKGDTPPRENLINRESVALDWSFMKKALEQQFGKRHLLIFGLCSGADNGIKIAAVDRDVKGLVLLDAVSPLDGGFQRRALISKMANISKWKRGPGFLWDRIMGAFRKTELLLADPTGLRDEPTLQDLHQCFRNLVAGQGRVLAVFTSHAIKHYNEAGQFNRALNVEGSSLICDELFWPTVGHLYSVQEHRDQLVQAVGEWGKRHIDHFRISM